MVLQYGGINEGDNSLSVSIAEIERNLHDTPWVEEVSVKKVLPDRFVIKLKERLPSFWIQKDGTLLLCQWKGEIIAPVESRNFLSLPTLTIEPGGEESSIYLSKLLKDLRNDVPSNWSRFHRINYGKRFTRHRDLSGGQGNAPFHINGWLGR